MAKSRHREAHVIERLPRVLGDIHHRNESRTTVDLLFSSMILKVEKKIMARSAYEASV